MSRPEDARLREGDTMALFVLRKRLALLQATYDDLLADFLAAKNAYYAQRPALREEILKMTEAIHALEAREKEE
jgi:hypothetical protein